MNEKCHHDSHAVVHHYMNGPEKPCLCGRYTNAAEQDADPVTVEEQEAQEQADALTLTGDSMTTGQVVDMALDFYRKQAKRAMENPEEFIGNSTKDLDKLSIEDLGKLAVRLTLVSKGTAILADIVITSQLVRSLDEEY